MNEATADRRRPLRRLTIVAVGVATFAASLALIAAQPARAAVPIRCVDTPAVLPIAAGQWTNYALGRDGSEWSWGDNARGQVGNGTTGSFPLPVNSSGFSGVQAVAAGVNHALVLRQDGTVWAWGANGNGQLGNGSIGGTYPVAAPVPNLGKVVAIAAGGNTSYAANSTGALFAWGYNGYGQLGNGTTTTSPVPVQVNFGLQKVKQIVTDPGGNHTVAITTVNQVFAWGNASGGSNGPNAVALGQTPTPSVVPPPAGVVPKAVAAGYNHSAFLAESGKVYVWGSNNYYQLGNGTTDIFAHPNPVEVPGLTGVTQISGGLFFTLAKKSDGTAYGWGDDYFGQIGDGGATSAPTVARVGTLTSIAAISAGHYGGMGVTDDGRVWTWGSNSNGQIGNGTIDANNPQRTPFSISLTQATPKAPTELSAGPGDGSVHLRWRQPVSVVTQYVITPYRDGVAQAEQTAPAGSTEFVVQNLQPNTPYTFEVAAQNCLGLGPATSKSDAVLPRNSEGNNPDAPVETSRISDRISMQVNVFNGNLTISNRDLALAGTGIDLVVGRTYNNLASSTGAAGRNWTLSGLSERQTTLADGSVVVTTANGAQIGFVKNADGTFASPPGIDAKLTSPGSTYVLADNASGEKWTFEQGASGRLISREDRNGNTLTYNSGSGTPGTTATIVDTKGQTTTLTYGDAGRIAEIADTAGRKGTYTYDPATGDLKTFTDQKGNAAGAGGRTEYSYDAAGNLRQITTPAGRVVTFDFDASKRLIAIHRPNQAGNPTTTFAYHPTNPDSTRTTVETDANLKPTTYTFDAAGRLLATVDAMNNAQSLTYTANSNIAAYSTGNGTASGRFGYDGSNNRTLSYVQPGAHSTAAFDDPAHPFQPSAITDPQNNTTRFAYDAAGNLTTATNPMPANNQTVVARNADGSPSSITDPAGRETTYGYDTKHNLNRVTPPSPLAATTATYDTLNRVESVTDGSGAVTTFTYDQLDRVTETKIDGVPQETTAFDDDGNPTSVTNQGGTATMTYDAMGRLIQRRTVHFSLVTNVTYTYDGVGNLLTITDAGGTTTYGYDAANRPNRVTDPAGKVTSIGYDANGNRTSISNGLGLATTLTYDSANRLINKRTTFNGQLVSFGDRTNSYKPSGATSGSARTISQRGDPSLFATNGNNTSAVTLAKPGGLANDDVAIAQIVVPGNATVTSVPAGWTLVRTDATGTTSNDVTARLYVHVVTAANLEPRVYSWGISGSLLRAAGGLTAWTGVDPASPIKASAGTAPASASTSPTAPALDYVNGELSLVAFGGRPWGAGAATSRPDKYTAAYDTEADWVTATASTRTLGAIAGTVAEKSVTGPYGTWAAQHLLLRPLYDSDLAQTTPTGTKTYDALNRLIGTGAGETFTYDAVGNRKLASTSTQTISDTPNAANQLASRNKPATWRAAATKTGTIGATSLSVNAPAGTKAGDVLIAQIAANPTGGAANGGAITPGQPGWNVIADATNKTHSVLYWRVATSSEPASYSWTHGSADYVVGAIGAYGGIDTTDPIDKTATATGTGTAPAAPSLTTTSVDDQLLVAVASAATSSYTSPTGTTQRWQAGTTATPAGSINTYDQLVRNTEVTGTKTATAGTSTQWVAHAVALRATTGYTYDANGNLTGNTDGGTLQYDGATNRTSAINGYNGAPNITRSYRSNDQSEIEQIVPATRQSASCANLWGCTGLSTTIGNSALSVDSVLGITTENVAGTYTYYVRDPAGNLVSARTPTGTYYYLTDIDGSVTHMIDTAGTIVASYGYDSWGRTTAMLASTIGINNPWRYRSGYQDGTGIYHFGARFYDPTLGRWTQQDPIYNPLDPKQANRYAYVGGDPINFSDPTGLKSLWDRAKDAVKGTICAVRKNPLGALSLTLGVASLLVGSPLLAAGLGIGSVVLAVAGSQNGDSFAMATGVIGAELGIGATAAALAGAKLKSSYLKGVGKGLGILGVGLGLLDLKHTADKKC